MGYVGFKALEGKLQGKVSNPGAVAALIGRKKYGNKVFDRAAAKHESLESKARARTHRMMGAQKALGRGK